jgi:prepilin-type N-terminal cleavage/methylation domain-containing protein
MTTVRARAKSRRHFDRGFTLIEVLISLVLSGLIAGVVVSVILTSLNAADSTTAEINDSNDAALVSSFLIRDGQASGGIDPATASASAGVSTTDPAGCTQTGALVVRFSWMEHSSATTHTPTVVTYVFNSATQTLSRRVCLNGSSTGTDVLLGSHITSAGATCQRGSSPDATCSRPTGVSLSLSGSGKRAPFSTTLTASLRSAPSQLLIVNPTTASMPIGEVGIVYPSTRVTTIGATAPTTWSQTGIPAGLTIDNTGLVAGTPTTSGQFTLTATIADKWAATAQRSYAITVSSPIAVVWSSMPNGKVGVTYSSTPGSASGGTLPYTWTLTGTLPSGLTLGAASGTISGTPTVAGTSSFNLTVTDASGATSQKSYNLVVDTATITECPAAATPWTGQYYANATLSNSPKFTQNDPDINFNWGSNGPGGGIGKDNFSIRWTRTTNFAAGNYTFVLSTDEGSRMYIDNVLIAPLNSWTAPQTTSFTQFMTGWHTVRVEYNEKSGNARASLVTTFASVTKVASNGVTAVPVVADNQPYFGELNIKLSNPSDVITAMSATFTVAQTPGVTYHGQYTDLPNSDIYNGHQTCTGLVAYNFTLTQGLTIRTPGSWVLAAQWDGTGTSRVTSGDTWSVTTTTAKGTTTITGTFP